MDLEYMLAVDTGTTKVCAVAARRNERKVIEVLGIGIHPCTGLGANGIVDMDDLVVSISSACNKALSHIPNTNIKHVISGVSGSFIHSANTVGSLVLSNHGRTVTRDDIDRCIESAKRKSVPKDYEVIQAVPRWFRLDDASEIRDPAGMEGCVLESDVHMIVGKHAILKNLRRCMHLAGFTTEQMVYQPLASSYSVLSEEEKQTGVALVDIGGETTTLMVFNKGSIYHSETIELGGEDITRDINHYFQTPKDTADHLKKYNGSAWTEGIPEGETVEIVRFKNRRTLVVEKRRLGEIIEARVEQILDEVLRCLRARDLLNELYAGIVITGGTSMLDGMKEKANAIIKKDVHIGYPNGVAGFEEMITSPSYATAIGLLHFGYEKRDEELMLYGKGMKRMIRSAVRWVHDTF